MEEEPDPGWTKPKQSFRLKKAIPRGRSVLGNSNANRTLPVLPSQQVKRKNLSENDEPENTSNNSANAKRQRLGDIFSPSSMFLQTKALPAALQRRVSENNQSTDSRGETIISWSIHLILKFPKIQFFLCTEKQLCQ